MRTPIFDIGVDQDQLHDVFQRWLLPDVDSFPRRPHLRPSKFVVIWSRGHLGNLDR